MAGRPPPQGGLSQHVAGNYTTPTPPTPTPPGQDRFATKGPNGPIDVNIWAMPVKMRQQFLAARGYNVKVDGKSGPQTATAAKAFIKGIPATYWNKVWHGNHLPPVLTNTADTYTAPPAAVDPTTPATVTTNPGVTPTPTQKIPGLGKFSLLDPTAYTNAAMAAKYGSPQAELARQLAQAGADQKGHQTDIKNWFASLISGQEAGGKANAAALGDILSGADKSNLGLVNALGGTANGASAGVASLGQLGRNALEQLAATQANFDDTQHTALGQQGMDAANQEYAKGQATKKDLASQMADLATQRGQDYSATLSGAQQDRFKQQIAIHDAKVSQAMLPGQLAGQAADNTNKALDTTYMQAKIDALKSSGNGVTDWTKPQTQNDWNEAVQHTIADKNGALTVDPQQAWIQIQHAMARNGISGNSTAMQVAKSAIQDSLSRSHARGMFKNWVWGPKGLVKLKAKPKK